MRYNKASRWRAIGNNEDGLYKEGMKLEETSKSSAIFGAPIDTLSSLTKHFHSLNLPVSHESFSYLIKMLFNLEVFEFDPYAKRPWSLNCKADLGR